MLFDLRELINNKKGLSFGLQHVPIVHSVKKMNAGRLDNLIESVNHY